MVGVQVLGSRVDGRPVWLILGGADDPAAGAAAGDGGTGAAAGAPATAAGAGTPGNADTTAGAPAGDEVEFSEENFKKLIDQHNATQAAIEAEREEWRQKLHRASQDASRFRQQARTLASLVGEGATGKPGPKPAAKNTDAGRAPEAGPDPEVARLAAELKATQTRMLASEAQAELLRAEANPRHVERLVRMLDLNADGNDVPALKDQIAELKADMPELFAMGQVAAGNGAGAAVTGARILRAAPAVAGRGAAGRSGGEAPKPPRTADILAARLMGGSES